MREKKLLFLTLLLCVLAGTLCACGSLSGKGRELRMNVTLSDSSAWQVAANVFKERIEERTGGRYHVRIYSNEELSGGDVKKGVENLFSGAVDLDLHAVADMQSYEKRLAVVSMPWLFARGAESVDEILFNGPGKEYLFSLIRERGAEPLALGESGFRQLTNDRRSIAAPEDLAGLVIQAPAGGVQASLLEALDAQAVFPDRIGTLSVLQGGAADGQENTLDAIRSGRLYLVQRFLTLWNCSYDPICLSVSHKVWESLSEEDRLIFREAAEEACAAEVTACRTAWENTLSDIAASGVEITELTEGEIRAFRERAAVVYAQWRDVIGDELFAAFGYVFD